MSEDAIVDRFYSNIEVWTNNHNILYKTESAGQVEKIISMGAEELTGLSATELSGLIFTLNKYAFHLAMIAGRERAAKHWAEQGIWFRICGREHHDKFAKWEDKYYSAVKNDKIAVALVTLKNTCEFRLLTIEPQIASIEAMVKNLENIVRGKMYEHRTDRSS